MSSNKPAQMTLVRILSILGVAIFVLLPFHALFTTWLGANFGFIDVFRVWKELLLLVMVAGCTWLLIANHQLRSLFENSWLPLLIVEYALLHVMSGAWALASNKVTFEALAYGLSSNLRFLAFFLVMVVLAPYIVWFRSRWQQLLLALAAIVIAFGVLQPLLPVDFLRHFGYGDDTIPAYHTVDNKLDYQRVQSTTRGPNPLGAYLVVVLTAGLVLLKAASTKSQKFRLGGLLLFGMFVLFLTYSRSAWIGLALATAALLFFSVQNARARRYMVMAGVGILVVFAGMVWVLRDNNFVQNTLFHSDENSVSSESSNEARTKALTGGFTTILEEPLGGGVGTAGPASVRNEAPPRIAENYFIQIGQEVGLIGLALFIAINVLVARDLWRQRKDTLSLMLLASLVGLTFINFVSHAWADDTLGMLWWGLAGIALSPVILKRNEAAAKR